MIYSKIDFNNKNVFVVGKIVFEQKNMINVSIGTFKNLLDILARMKINIIYASNTVKSLQNRDFYILKAIANRESL